MNYLPRKSRVLIEMCSTLGEECKDNPRAIGQQVQLQNWEMRCLHRKAHLVISLKAICVWKFSEPSRLSYYNHPSYIVDLDIILYIIWGSLISSFPSQPDSSHGLLRHDRIDLHVIKLVPVLLELPRLGENDRENPSCCISYGCN